MGIGHERAAARELAAFLGFALLRRPWTLAKISSWCVD